jgi:hypothetical protein
MRSKKGESLSHGHQDGFHIAISKRRDDQSDNFAISRVVVAMNKLNGIVRNVTLSWEFVEKSIQVMLQLEDSLR